MAGRAHTITHSFNNELVPYDRAGMVALILLYSLCLFSGVQRSFESDRCIYGEVNTIHVDV